MKSLIGISILAFFLSGCSFLQINENLTIEQKASLVKGASRTATYIALKEIYKDNRDKLLEKALFIKNHLVFHIDGDITLEKIQIALMAHIPGEYKMFIQGAIDVFNLYFTVNTENLLNIDNQKLITAFMNGILEACDLILFEK